MVTSGEDGTARIWDVTSEREPRVFNPNDGPATTATFSPDDRTIVAATMGGQPARVWDVSSGQELVRLPEHGTAVWAAAFSPGGGHSSDEPAPPVDEAPNMGSAGAESLAVRKIRREIVS